MSRSSLADAAYAELRSAILAGDLAPGATIVETDVASLLDVSRTPVREALRRLELEGYLERQPGGRLSVHSYTDREIRDLFLVRGLLEGYAARLAATRISDGELDELERLLERDMDALRDHEIDELAALNDQIHGVVLEASRNRTLRDLVANLRERIHGLGAFAIGAGEDQHRFVEEHARMVGLLREGDAEAVEDLAREHVHKARDVLLEGLASGGLAAVESDAS
jgi:DNA-binding GntR family transcriptional regulator